MSRTGCSPRTRRSTALATPTDPATEPMIARRRPERFVGAGTMAAVTLPAPPPAPKRCLSHVPSSLQPGVPLPTT